MDEIRKIQLLELDMLKEFDKICNQLELRYYALGGTLLGAVRHGGFIPWDDDIDIGMPRNDYEIFIQRASQLLPTNMVIKTNKLNLNIMQIVNTNTRVKLGKEEMGVFIDIFPLDGYPSSKFLSLYQSKKVIFYRMLCKMAIIDSLVERDRGFLENAITTITKKFHLNKALNSDKLVKKIHNIIKKYDFETSLKVGNVLGRYRSREIVEKMTFGEGTTIKFEDIEIRVPSGYAAYLKAIYGDDYMELPPTEQRVAHQYEIISLGDNHE